MLNFDPNLLEVWENEYRTFCLLIRMKVKVTQTDTKLHSLMVSIIIPILKIGPYIYQFWK